MRLSRCLSWSSDQRPWRHTRRLWGSRQGGQLPRWLSSRWSQDERHGSSSQHDRCWLGSCWSRSRATCCHSSWDSWWHVETHWCSCKWHRWCIEPSPRQWWGQRAANQQQRKNEWWAWWTWWRSEEWRVCSLSVESRDSPHPFRESRDSTVKRDNRFDHSSSWWWTVRTTGTTQHQIPVIATVISGSYRWY